MMITQQKLGRILIWMGVLAWAPFLYLVAVGRDVSIYPFLAIHLTGILGGTRLRSKSSLPTTAKKRALRQVLGRVMIFLGVLAWVPYLYKKDILAQQIDISPYLTVHLTGVLGGIALLLSLHLARRWRQSQQTIS